MPSSRLWTLTLGLALGWLSLCRAEVVDEKTTVYLTSAHGKNTFTIPRQQADRIPFWDPMLDAPAPISMSDAWRIIHADAQKAAGDSPLDISLIKIIHGQGKVGAKLWFYRFDASYMVIRDQTLFRDSIIYIVLMDGNVLTDVTENGGAKLPPNFAKTRPHRVPVKLPPGPLPEEVTLVTLTSSNANDKIKVPYVIPRQQFAALPAWDFDQAAPPPVSLDDALAAVRRHSTEQWPGQVWKFADIQLTHGKSPETYSTYFYAVTVLRDTPNPKLTPPLLSLQLVLMDGTLVDADPTQLGKLGQGFGW